MAVDSNNLIIVESPSKARTLKRYLGDNYQIEASVGHIRDLPKSDLGVDVDNGSKILGGGDVYRFSAVDLYRH